MAARDEMTQCPPHIQYSGEERAANFLKLSTTSSIGRVLVVKV